MLEKGQIVRNPKQLEWGLGRVIQIVDSGELRIQFMKRKFRTIDPAFVNLEVLPKEDENVLPYPVEWEDEWKRTGTLRHWRDEFSELFDGSRGKIEPTDRKLSNFANYALMYLLRRNDGVESLTYFELAHHAKTSSTTDRRDHLQGIMRKVMGSTDFDKLKGALAAAGFSGFTGEPDLFCWNERSPDSDRSSKPKWFFAEAKRDDPLLLSQHNWFYVCRETLPHAVIQVYRIKPQTPIY